MVTMVIILGSLRLLVEGLEAVSKVSVRLAGSLTCSNSASAASRSKRSVPAARCLGAAECLVDGDGGVMGRLRRQARRIASVTLADAPVGGRFAAVPVRPLDVCGVGAFAGGGPGRA